MNMLPRLQKLQESALKTFAAKRIDLNSNIENAHLLAADETKIDAELRFDKPQRKWPRRTCKIMLMLSCTILLWLYIQAVRSKGETNGVLFLGNEVIYSDAPTALETHPLDRAGFHRNDGSDPDTAFESRPNEKNDAAWHHILNVGMIAITEEENARLPNGGSSRVRNDPEHRVVLLSLFHQLHCLKYLRDLIYDFDEGAVIPGARNEYQLMHGDHCIDYLRQVLICHGDLTPIRQHWEPSLHAYAAEQETVHQCRDFQKIWEWAAERNTTGLRADGKHEKHEKHENE
ncbi:uncharacterized protein RHO25_012310 [Cercospora beticola]|uniref:Oxidase ustYa n=1 Tax=Cercospora beticola TaxID=122368 RepID=A0ABZ0P6Z7_CERBT|nr:hypothetical protein RHO25_012310 [Cercospora beticola]CAK1356547.1 unnamed protein product [Cercospora beticola]